MTPVSQKVVFDCVVFAQALISPSGPAGECVKRALVGSLQLFVSQYVIDEIRDLYRKIPSRYGVTLDQINNLADDVTASAVFISAVPSVYLHPHDPNDSHYVDLAVATKSNLIVSRDRHLLQLMDATRGEGRDFLRRFPGISVIAPHELLVKLRENNA
jgi:putative PIN family toxin of toxin-antitoxin system